MAWVRTSELNKSGNNQNNQQISARLNEMINGNFKNGVYKNHTTYKGPYAKEQCKGFAKSITQELFGYTIGSTQKKPYNYLINTTSKTRKVGAISSISNDSQLKSLLTLSLIHILTVHLIGGDLNIEITDGSVFMTGPATTVFEGEIDL